MIVATKWANGKKEQIREWVPNPVDNQHLSGKAVVIGEGNVKIKPFYFENHKGGLLGRDKVQTYGVETVGNKVATDFLVVMNPSELQTQLETKLSDHTAIYTSTANCIANPGRCFMVPYNFKSSSIAVATYLAAFDGHKEVFLVGSEPPLDATSRNKYIAGLLLVFQTYASIRFRIITDNEYEVPKEWRSLRNIEVWNYRKFISECDIG